MTLTSMYCIINQQCSMQYSQYSHNDLDLHVVYYQSSVFNAILSIRSQWPDLHVLYYQSTVFNAILSIRSQWPWPSCTVLSINSVQCNTLNKVAMTLTFMYCIINQQCSMQYYYYGHNDLDLHVVYYQTTVFNAILSIRSQWPWP